MIGFIYSTRFRASCSFAPRNWW